MGRYVILANPGHNRIYFDAMKKMAFTELKAVFRSRGMMISDVRQEEVNIPFAVSFTSGRELKTEDLRTLGTLSFFYVLFESNREGLLKPVSVPDFHVFPESMVQILKYNGKTNEQFTRLLVNLACSVCRTGSKKISLLDPMCGKGTTLYEGLTRGFDVTGIEASDKWFQEGAAYAVRYMKEGRYKHRTEKAKLSDAGGRKTADYFGLKAAVSKENFKAGNLLSLDFYNGDTRDAACFLKKKSFDLLVCDLPYGVQHGGRNADGARSSRSPREILRAAASSWHEVMKPGGGLAVAYNEYTLKKIEADALLSENGFEVITDFGEGFLHRVDQAINRNLTVAVRK